jgi:hypothetical protein
MNTEDDKPTESELSMLTEEERAGLADDADEGGEEEQEEEEAENPGGGEAEPAAKPAPSEEAPAAEPAKVEEPKVEEPETDEDTPVPAPLAGGRVDEQAVQSKLEEIKGQKDALSTKLDEGEITTKEFTDAVDKLNDERNGLSNQLQRQQEHDKAMEDGWFKDVGKFLDKNPHLKENQTRIQSFDAVVRRVTADPANAKLTNRKQLDKAHEIWRDEIGYVDKTAAPAPAPAPKPKPKPAVELPPSLHNAPAADVAEVDDSKYAYLDALLNANRTLDYEAALEKLPEADQMDYLSRG